MIEENLEKTEARKYSFETELLSEEENTRKSYRLRRMIEICEEATDMLYKISREFDAIERRYNKLIEQKTVFASRAAADNLVHYDGRCNGRRSDSRTD